MNTKTILIIVIAMVLFFGAAFVYFNNFAHPSKVPEITYYLSLIHI